MQTTQIEKRKIEGVMNKEFVQLITNLSDLEYNTKIYETGIEFLQESYGFNSEFFRFFERLPLFWKWWRQEYFMWEQDLIRACGDDLSFDRQFYLDEMRIVAHDRRTDQSFNGFLKMIKHVRLPKRS